MRAKTVLISGAGIAGPTLAFWLRAAGFEPTIVERARELRRGGYVIDFWGLGYDVAERMGLTCEIDRAGYHIRELKIVNANSKRIAGFGTDVFSELTGGRYVTIERSALSQLLFEKIKDAMEIIFSNEIVAVQELAERVLVKLKDGAERSFDLLIGADGLHSGIRRLVFGPQDAFEKRLGYIVAAFEASGYRPRDEDVYVVYNTPGRMLGRVALHDDRTCSCSFSLWMPTWPCSICRGRRRFCGTSSQIASGNAGAFLMNLPVQGNFILTASAK
jgi:2-polyprenyl-6-methoxyphenol hydroxylase-like FAD-dependent oxidoreductase